MTGDEWSTTNRECLCSAGRRDVQVSCIAVHRTVDGSGQQLGGAGLTHENVK